MLQLCYSPCPPLKAAPRNSSGIFFTRTNLPGVFLVFPGVFGNSRSSGRATTATTTKKHPEKLKTVFHLNYFWGLPLMEGRGYSYYTFQKQIEIKTPPMI